MFFSFAQEARSELVKICKADIPFSCRANILFNIFFSTFPFPPSKIEDDASFLPSIRRRAKKGSRAEMYFFLMFTDLLFSTNTKKDMSKISVKNFVIIIYSFDVIERVLELCVTFESSF